MAFSFSTAGATPNAAPNFNGTLNLQGSTPQSKALNTAVTTTTPQTKNISSPSLSPQQNSGPLSEGTLNLSNQPATSGLLSAQPSTPLKKQTQTNVDGSVVTNEYHPPITTATNQTNASTSSTPNITTNSSSNSSLPTQTSIPTTFPGLLGTVAGQGTQSSALQTSAQTTGQNAADTYNQLNTQLAQSRLNEKDAIAQNNLQPIPIGDQQGRAQVLRDQYLQEQSALAQQAAGATALYGPSIGAATTAQGQQFGAAQNAASFAQPSGSFPFVFNPTTGTFTNGSGSGASTGITGAPTLTYNPQTDATTLAKAVINHQIGLSDAQQSLGYAGTIGTGLLNLAIVAQGGNPTLLQGQSDIQGQQQLQTQQWTSSLQQAQNLQSQLSDLITSFGLNPTDLNAANAGLQKIATNTSDPRYQALNSYLADIASVYSNILTPPGGSATDTTRSIASGLLDGTAKGQSIIAQMQVLDNQAQAKISGVNTIGGTSQSNSLNSSVGSINTKAADGNSYSFHQDASGKWVTN